MSDDSVSKKIKEYQNMFPDFVNSNGTIEYEILLLKLTMDIAIVLNGIRNDNVLQNANTLSYLDSIYVEDVEIHANTDRIP